MTTTNNNQTTTTANNNQVTNNAAEQVKTRSLKCLANDAAKLEMFSLKGATNAVKNAFDVDTDKVNTRAYIEGLGFTAKTFKGLTWQELQPYATTKSGRFSTWAVLNALKKYADDKDIKGEKAEKERKAAERKAAKEAAERIKAKKEQERKAKAEKENKKEVFESAVMLELKAKQKADRRAAKKNVA